VGLLQALRLQLEMEGWQVAGQIGMPGEAQQKKLIATTGLW